MENAAQQASALFSDATSEQLLAGGARVISDALARLSIPTVENIEIPHASRGYLICENDRLPWNMQVELTSQNWCFERRVEEKRDWAKRAQRQEVKR